MSDLLTPAIVFGGGNAADLLSTEYAREHGAREGNPLGQEYGHRLLLKSGATLALTGADLVLQKVERRYVVVARPGFMPERRKTTLAKAATVSKWTMRGVAAAYYAQLAIRNTKVGTEAHERARDLSNGGAR